MVLRRAGWVSALGILTAICGGYYSIQLFKNLKTDIEELLPTTARSVIDLNEVTGRLESTDNIAVLIFSQHPNESRRFVSDLAARLSQFPRSVVAGVEYNIRRELDFFEKRRALFIDLPDLQKIRNFIEKRIEYEKELYNPLNIFRSTELPEPMLNIRALQQKYEGKASSYTRFPDGNYATPDGKLRILLAKLPGKLSGISGQLALKNAVDLSIAELNPKLNYSPDIEIKFAGGVQEMIEEHHALIADLGLSTVVVILLVSLAMFGYFRDFRATIALLASLMVGTLWTFGISYFAVGYLNANSAFLGSIVIGNGINFGIIFLARYIEERKRNHSNLRSIRTAMSKTASSTWTAALAAGLAYGSLMLTEFRGFRQFGVIGLIGMVLCWLSAFTLLPAFLTLMDRGQAFSGNPKRKPEKKYSLPGLVASLVSKYPTPLWVGSFILTLVSLLLLFRFDSSVLETDLKKLRDKHSMEQGAGYLSKYVDDVFQRYLSPLVALPRTHEDAREIANKFKERQAQEGKTSQIAAVLTIDDFVPTHQEEKIKLLEEIRGLLPPRIVARLDDKDRKLIKEFLDTTHLKPFGVQDLPNLLKSRFTEKDGSVGKMVLVEPPLQNNLNESANLISFIKSLRQTVDSVKPGTAVAGTLAVTSDMFEAITRDGPRATLFAFLAVVLLTLFLFRDFVTTGRVLFALLLGVSWMFGAVMAFGIKINFLNFIALPITFGIGVDYGVNIFQRYVQEGPGSIIRVLRYTGGAVALASLTTTIGYGSLLIAGNRAFVSFGTMAVLGEITCLAAAMISLPAYLCYRHRRLKAN